VLKNSNVKKIFCMDDSYVDLRSWNLVLSAEKNNWFGICSKWDWPHNDTPF
jgi:hypothetical protein